MKNEAHNRPDRRANRTILGRTLFLMLLFGVVAFIPLFAKLYDLQIVQQKELQSKALGQQTRDSLVAANRCIAPLPLVNYRELRLLGKAQGVVYRPYEGGAPTAYFGIAYHKRRPLTPHGQRFRDFVRSYFQNIDRQYEARFPEAEPHN